MLVKQRNVGMFLRKDRKGEKERMKENKMSRRQMLYRESAYFVFNVFRLSFVNELTC